ncbi:hypothetical protein EGW08_020647 [Elysia chlorotica]|uniref:Uncharacterized protein n=1 Tax=Elysia chlorotica TaxID=188477 RepID=A0A433SQR6_ELYCH|nr:hypothetical protein EGW08_020647 [Elysia chlorotica]
MMWVRAVPMALLASSLFYFVFLSHTGLLRSSTTSSSPTSRASHSQPQRQELDVARHGLIPYTVLNRGHAVRDRELGRARQALEYWWSIRQADRGGAAGACPMSVSGPPTLSRDEDEARQVFYQLQAISVMEALGFDNVTTCEGRYPRIIVDIQALREGKDNVYMTANYSSDVSSSSETARPAAAVVVAPRDQTQGNLFEPTAALPTKQDEEVISNKFCYTPLYRPFMAHSDGDQQANSSSDLKFPPPRASLSPRFCPQLLQLYRDILIGKEPPLLTLFTWIPDPIEDQYRLSRHIMLDNLEMFRPFIRPVLVSDRRQIMAIAHGNGWPCLPIRQLSPDNLPVFKPIAEDIMAQFNSTFYGYARATSAFDTSLLETLIAVKHKLLDGRANTRPPEHTNEVPNPASHTTQQQQQPPPELRQSTLAPSPPVIIYGSAMYKNNLQTVKTFRDLGHQADQRGRTDWPDRESPLVYFLHTKMDVSDLPPLKIEDKFLNPFLVTRSRMKGHVTVDASRTLLCLMNNVKRRRPAWNRVDLPTETRDLKYNSRLAAAYIRATTQRLPGKNITMDFDKGGNILFQGV